MNTRISFKEQSLHRRKSTKKVNNIVFIINQVIFQIDKFDTLQVLKLLTIICARNDIIG